MRKRKSKGQGGLVLKFHLALNYVYSLCVSVSFDNANLRKNRLPCKCFYVSYGLSVAISGLSG